MAGIFKLIYPAPLSVRVRSRDCCTYLYRAMLYVGWIPPKQGIRRYLYLSWGCLYFMLCHYVPVGLALSIYMNSKGFTPFELFSCLQLLIETIGSLIKNIIMFYFLNRLHNTMPLLDSLDERLQCDSDREKLHRGVAVANQLFLAYGKLYLVYLVSDYIVGVAIGQPLCLLYNPFVDSRNESNKLWLQSLLEHQQITMLALVVLIMDTYSTLILKIILSHFDILREHIRNLRSDPLKTEADNYDELASCISYYQAIIDCCESIRPIVSRTIFVQFVLIGSMLGVGLINVLYFSEGIQVVSPIGFAAAVLAESFPFCYFCDMLVEESVDLPNILGQSNWIDADRKYKSSLLVFMIQLQKPVIFIAGGLFPISLNSNIKMAKFAFSVMTLLQTMNLTDRFN